MVKKFKHKKIKNTGLLYELLIRQMTSDVLKGESPKSVSLIKKYFRNGSPLKEELNLYNTLYNMKEKDSFYVMKIIDAAVKSRKTIDTKNLDKLKYNLVREIKDLFEKDIFLKTQIDNYKLYASIYNIFENKEIDNPSLYLKNKLLIANHIMSDSTEVSAEKQDFMESVDPELRSLTFKLLTEKFNSKWSSTLDKYQKEILRHFIFNSVDNEDTKKFISEHTGRIKSKLSKKLNETTDMVIKIKLKEILTLLPTIESSAFITENHYLSLIRYYELAKELN